MRRQRAFTLIEITAVMVVIALLAVFVPLSLDSLVAERELESEVAKLATTVEMIHTQTILDQAPYAIHYDMEADRWAYQLPDEISGESADDDSDQAVTVLVLDEELDIEELDWHKLPAGVKLQLYEGKTRLEGSYRVMFNPNGTVSPHTVVFESDNVSSLDEHDRSRTVKVNFPGFVSLAVGRIVEDFKKSEAELGD